MRKIELSAVTVGKAHLMAELHQTGLDSWGYSREAKTLVLNLMNSDCMLLDSVLLG